MPVLTGTGVRQQAIGQPCAGGSNNRCLKQVSLHRPQVPEAAQATRQRNFILIICIANKDVAVRCVQQECTVIAV